nr:MAG TPA: hypothetical protein [Caudoviricetes sp.]
MPFFTTSLMLDLFLQIKKSLNFQEFSSFFY